MTSQEIAEEMVAAFEERADYSESEINILPYMIFSSTYIAVEVMDSIIWDNEDENSPPENEADTFESAMDHAENVLANFISAMQSLLVK